jgi:hypothetical protein
VVGKVTLERAALVDRERKVKVNFISFYILLTVHPEVIVGLQPT